MSSETSLKDTSAATMPCQMEDQTMEDLDKLLQTEVVEDAAVCAVEGDDPCTDEAWDDLIKDAEILQAIDEMGFKKPSVVQCQVIPKLCQENVALLVQAPSGCGMTVAFTVPMLYQVDKSLKSIQSVCLCHTPELVNQAMQTFEKLNARSQVNFASLVNNKDTIPNDCQVLFCHPRDLAEAIKKRKLDVTHVKIVIVDEADALLKKNGYYVQSIKDLLERLLPHTAQLGFFSETFPVPIRKDVERLCGSRKLITITNRSVPKTISHWLIKQERENSYNFVGELYRKVNFGDRIIVFTGSKVNVQQLQDYLQTQGVPSATFSGGKHASLEERNRVIEEFKSGQVKVLITTDLGARGLDVPEVRLVINLDFPYKYIDGRRSGPDFDLYQHRAGRCGRFGRTGAVLNVYQHDVERDLYEKVFRTLGIDKAYNLVG